MSNLILQGKYKWVRLREAITKESIKRDKEQDQSSHNAERMTESLIKNRSESHDSHRHR